ncbi:putative gustatory receptor 28a [Fopius arisanus]|uniref:Gustatory receptor n=1 Tax=Fopius arisanus TaxID=64838 RepID=A0A9R1TFE9_9HYME|nr:PREDICTED: putative gustatory receptor 28a [Fopius arisanus]
MMKPILFLYLFYKILGLLPFSIRLSPPRTDDSKKCSVSFLGLVYNWILILVTFTLSFPAVEAFYDIQFDYKTKTVMTIGMTRAISSTIVTLFIWLFVSLRQLKAVEITQRLLTIDKMLMTLKNVHYHESLDLRMIAIIWTNVFIWINVFWLDMTVFKSLFKSSFVIFILPNVIFNWFLIQYSLVLSSIETRFRGINRAITRLSKSHCCLIEDTRVFRDLMALHGLLYDVACAVTNFYAFPVLLIITVSCGAILTTSYYLIVPFLMHRAVSIFRTLDSIAYLAMEVFPIVILSTTVTRVSHEMKLTTVAVHKLLAESLSDKQLKSELKLFSLELLHRRLQFTCCGIFSLDCTLLHSIANMTGTYLVILIQFQGTERTSTDHVTSNNIILNTIFNETCASNQCGTT